MNTKPSTETDLRKEAMFLIERLKDFEGNYITEENAGEWFGHVEPSLERLTALTRDNTPTDPWKGIEEHDGNGAEILTIDAIHGKSDQMVVWWHTTLKCWMHKNERLSNFFTPTHWMTLPSPPKPPV